MDLIQSLLASTDPAIVYRVRRDVLDEPETLPEMRALREQIRQSSAAVGLLSHRNPDGTQPASHTYAKWQGAHFTLACLGEVLYPPGDVGLIPIREQVYEWLFAERHMCMPHTLILEGNENPARRCTSQEGYDVWALLTIGLADERTEELVRRLRRWQWTDGGWNCDKRPEASHASFEESGQPLRALALHARLTGDTESRAAADRAAEMFLERRSFRRKTTGEIISPHFMNLHFPFYYHYTVLTGLVILAEGGYIRDPRCAEALDWLESRRLPDGGFAQERCPYIDADHPMTHGSYADWGPRGRRTRNDWVTVNALAALHAAGRVP